MNVTRAYLHRHARKESPDARRDAVGRMVLQEIDVRPAPVSAILAALRRRPDFPYYGNKSDFDIADVVQRLIAQNLATYQYTPDGKTCNLVPVQPYAKLRLTDPIHQTMALRDMTTRITKALHQREHEIVARTVDDQRTVVAQETTVCYPASMTLIEVSRMYVEEGSRAFFAREAAWKAAGVPLASMRIDQLFSTAKKDQP